MHTLKSLVETIASLRERLGALAQNTEDPSAGSWLVERLNDIEQEIATLDFSAISEFQLEDFGDALSDIEGELKVQFSSELQMSRPAPVPTTPQSRTYDVPPRPAKRRGNRR